MISQRPAIPTNDDDFEALCLDLLKRYLSRDHLELYGKRGERQHGIDILDLSGVKPLFAAQCKLKEEHKSLPPAEIEEEVGKARQFTPPLESYFILTTAKVSTSSQRKVQELNLAHKKSGLFEIKVLNWEHICNLLREFPDVSERFYSDIGKESANRIESRLLDIHRTVDTFAAGAGDPDIDRRIDQARNSINNREFQVATLLLNLLEESYRHRLTESQKYRIRANQGAAALGSDKPEKAAELFLAAADILPQDEQAQINVALAHLLVGDLVRSHELSTSLRARYPASGRLAALWISTAPTEVSWSEIVQPMNKVLRSNPEVSLALSRRALGLLLLSEAEELARTAASGAPEWSQPSLTLAEIISRRVFNYHFREGHFKETESLLREAERLCSVSLELAETEKDTRTQVAALTRRISIRVELKNLSGAAEDSERTKTLDPDNPQVILAVAHMLVTSGKIDGALAMLAEAHQRRPVPQVAYLYGKVLSDRGRSADLKTASRVLAQIALKELEEDLRPELSIHAVQALSKAEDWSGAEEYLKSNTDLLSPSLKCTLQAYLAHGRGLQNEAALKASAAKEAHGFGCSHAASEFLARLLMILGMPSDALPILQSLFSQDASSFHTAALLECAGKLRRDDIIIATCKCARERGLDDWNFIGYECNYLEKYDIEGAIKLLIDFIYRHPEHKLAKLRLSLIGLRLLKPDLVAGNLEDVPDVDSLPAEFAVQAVQVVRYGGNPDVAVDYAYNYLRKNFNIVEAHRALFVSLMPGWCAPNIPPELEVSGPGSAVCYQELPAGAPVWKVLEVTDCPSNDFEEISISAPLAEMLSGKRAGDLVVIAKGSISNRSARIIKVVPKYVRRFQDSMAEMQIRFGASSILESVQIGAQVSDQDAGLQAVLALIKDRSRRVDEVRTIYRETPLTLHMYGASFGTTSYAGLMDLAQDTGQQIKCFNGGSEEQDNAIRLLQTAQVVVLDLTALATLRLLRLEKILTFPTFQFVISQSTWVARREMISEAKVYSGPSATLRYESGSNVVNEESAEAKAKRLQEDEEFLSLLERSTTRRSAFELAAFDPDRRGMMEQYLGIYGSESVILASKPGYILWTDDMMQAEFGAREHGAPRVWTQVFLRTLTDSGLLTSDEYSGASALLVGMQYGSTSFDESSLLAAARIADYSCARFPLAQFIDVLSKSGDNAQQLFAVFIGFIARLYREAIGEAKCCSVVEIFFDALGTKPGGLQSLKTVRKLSAQIFGLNAVGNKRFDKCFDRWLKNMVSPVSST